jgi:N-acetylmuramic acid 6-phosphate etherase
MPTPPDRSHVTTEQRHPGTMRLHEASISECVEILRREDEAVARAMREAAPALTRFIEAVEPGFLRGGRLVYLGAGTSGRLGVLDASELPPTFQLPPGSVVGIIAGGDSALRVSSEGKEDDPGGAVAELSGLSLRADDAVLGIAAGGTTPYVLGGLRWCAGLGSPPITGLLTCAPGPTPPGVGHAIVLATGPEVVTGSTRMKAGTATKLALNTISTTLMVRSGRVYENLMVDLRATNAKLRDRAARIVATLTGLSREGSFGLLDRAGGSVKAAVVMHRRGVEREEAERRLAGVGGRLHEALAGA